MTIDKSTTDTRSSKYFRNKNQLLTDHVYKQKKFSFDSFSKYFHSYGLIDHEQYTIITLDHIADQLTCLVWLLPGCC